MLCVYSKIYPSVDHPMNEYLSHIVAARNTRVSAARGESALVIPRCGTSLCSRSFLPAAMPLWILPPSGVFRGDTLSFFKIARTCAH